MTIKITSPVEGLNHKTEVGSTVLEFKDGVAEVDELSDAVRSYLFGAGFQIDGESVELASLDGSDLIDPADLDSRDLESPETVGTALRDAAVDPREGDFLVPTNAGEADPHGDQVVSPEIHAAVTGPIVPGIVASETEYQDAKETAVAEAVRVEGAPVPDVMKAIGEYAKDEEAEALEEAAAVGTDEENAGTQDDINSALPDPGKVDDKIEDQLEKVEDAGKVEAPVVLKGNELDAALDKAKLPKSGTADEKRARLADHQAKA